jgi:hypothetical protein
VLHFNTFPSYCFVALRNDRGLYIVLSLDSRICCSKVETMLLWKKTNVRGAPSLFESTLVPLMLVAK